MTIAIDDLQYDAYYEVVRAMQQNAPFRWLPPVDDDAFVLEAIESPKLVIFLA